MVKYSPRIKVKQIGCSFKKEKVGNFKAREFSGISLFLVLTSAQNGVCSLMFM